MSPHLRSPDLGRLEAVGFTPAHDLLVITEATVSYPLPENVLQVDVEGFIPITLRRFEDANDVYKLLRDFNAVFIDLLRAIERNGWRHYRFPQLTFDGAPHYYTHGLVARHVEARVSLCLIR